MFIVRIKRDKKKWHRKREYIIPVTAEDGGFSIEIHHGRFDRSPITISGFMGDTVISTTIESHGSPRIKRVTNR